VESRRNYQVLYLVALRWQHGVKPAGIRLDKGRATICVSRDVSSVTGLNVMLDVRTVLRY
jgi:hypothetical protein